jgi:hypothetical protein
LDRGSGLDKIWIRDKHPGSATLVPPAFRQCPRLGKKLICFLLRSKEKEKQQERPTGESSSSKEKERKRARKQHKDRPETTTTDRPPKEKTVDAAEVKRKEPTTAATSQSPFPVRTSEAKSSAQVFSVERPKGVGAPEGTVPRPKAAESLATAAAAAVSAKSHAVPHAIR